MTRLFIIIIFNELLYSMFGPDVSTAPSLCHNIMCFHIVILLSIAS